MQLDVLWQFMQVDMEADRFETGMRQSESRQKLIRQRNFLMEQQANMKKLESEIAIMQDRLAAIEDEAERLTKLVDTMVDEADAEPPKNAQEADEKTAAVRKLFDTILRYEQELQHMRQDAEAKDRAQRDIRLKAAKTKVEYDQLKQSYDVEFKADSAKLQQMRANIEKESARVEPSLLERYRSIKQHCTPPMAKLVNGQCSGCFMSLPSATMLELREGGIVECDNCGRIIYDPK